MNVSLSRQIHPPLRRFSNHPPPCLADRQITVEIPLELSEYRQSASLPLPPADTAIDVFASPPPPFRVADAADANGRTVKVGVTPARTRWSEQRMPASAAP
jgi:hypothetical protein